MSRLYASMLRPHTSMQVATHIASNQCSDPQDIYLLDLNAHQKEYFRSYSKQKACDANTRKAQHRKQTDHVFSFAAAVVVGIGVILSWWRTHLIDLMLLLAKHVNCHWINHHMVYFPMFIFILCRHSVHLNMFFFLGGSSQMTNDKSFSPKKTKTKTNENQMMELPWLKLIWVIFIHSLEATKPHFQ